MERIKELINQIKAELYGSSKIIDNNLNEKIKELVKFSFSTFSVYEFLKDSILDIYINHQSEYIKIEDYNNFVINEISTWYFLPDHKMRYVSVLESVEALIKNTKDEYREDDLIKVERLFEQIHNMIRVQ